MTTLYIAGPMTGIPEHNLPMFNRAQALLERAGFTVLNPARHGAGEPGTSWSDYMRRDIPDVLACDGIALLPDWENSKGARLEVYIADALDIPARSIYTHLPHDWWHELKGELRRD